MKKKSYEECLLDARDHLQEVKDLIQKAMDLMTLINFRLQDSSVNTTHFANFVVPLLGRSDNKELQQLVWQYENSERCAQELSYHCFEKLHDVLRDIFYVGDTAKYKGIKWKAQSLIDLIEHKAAKPILIDALKKEEESDEL